MAERKCLLFQQLFHDNYSFNCYLWILWKQKNRSPSLFKSFLSYFPHVILDFCINWNRPASSTSSTRSVFSASPSSLWYTWKWLSSIVILIVLFLYEIFLNYLMKKFITFPGRLFIDEKYIGNVNMTSFQLSSLNDISFELEIDCEGVLVSISTISINWNVKEIINLFLSKYELIPHNKNQSTSLKFIITNWQTTSLQKINFPTQMHKISKRNYLFNQFCYQYSHPQIIIPIQSHLSSSTDPHPDPNPDSNLDPNKKQQLFIWNILESEGLEIFQRHLLILFSTIRDGMIQLPSHCSLSSPSLHLFLTSLAYNTLPDLTSHQMNSSTSSSSSEQRKE